MVVRPVFSGSSSHGNHVTDWFARLARSTAAKLAAPSRRDLANEKFTDAFERELLRREAATRWR
jgi:hypothetical protein